MIRELFLSDFPLSSCVWQSTIFLVVGLVSSFILRHRSARAHQVLFLAMMAAVIVPIMSILVKHYELGVFVAEPVVIQSRAEDVGRVGNFGAPGTISAEDIEHKPGTIEKDLQPATLASESTKLPWRSVVLYAWIAASLILATRLLVTFVLGARLLGRALPLNCERIEEALRLARAKLGIDKDVMVRSSRGVRSPVIWCWRQKPVLLVPSAAGQSDNGVDWAGVLCHELAHYKRRDHISGLLAELAVCILPWHPLLWWAKSRLVRLSEQACDDWVVATGQPCTDYAESLLDLTPGGQMAFVPAVVSSKRGLAGRVRRILQDNCSNPRTGVAWALAVSFLAACLAVGVACAQTRPAKPQTATEHEAKPSKSLHEAAADGDIEQVKSLISKGADVNAKNENNWTALHSAADEGHSGVSKILITNGADVNAKDNWGYTPLHWAIWSKDKETIRLLVNNGTDVNVLPKGDSQALHYAVWDEDMELVKLFVNNGAKFNVKDQDGWTAFRYAVSGGNRELFEFFVAKGANASDFHTAAWLGDLNRVKRFVEQGTDVNTKDDQLNWTPLHWVAFTGQQDVVEFLLAKGASVNVKDEFNTTPLHHAAVAGHRELVELFLAKGAEVNAKDDFGKTPLHSAVKQDRQEVVALLIASGADVNAKYPDGRTALHRAAEKGYKEVVNLLIAKGADVNAKDENGWTPLHRTCSRGRKDMAELLISKGADVNVRNKDGGVPLHYAASRGHREVVELLITKGVDVNARSDMNNTSWGGWTALHCAARHNRKIVAELLIANGADLNAKNRWDATPLHTAAKNGQKEVGEVLIDSGANVNAKNQWGRTPLDIAVDQGQRQIIELLRKHGAKTVTFAGATPLHEAAAVGDINLVKSLISKGADVNAKANTWHTTPLIAAIRNGHEDIAKLLITKGADIKAKGRGDYTALHWAAMNRARMTGSTDLMKVLLTKGADIEARQEHGATPLACAAFDGNTESANFLIKHGAGIEAKLDDGETTPLFRAVRQQYVETAKLLLAKGADIHVRWRRLTPLHVAMMGNQLSNRKSDKEMVKLLIEKSLKSPPIHLAAYFGDLQKLKDYLTDGTRINEKDAAGYTPLHCAVCGDHMDIARFLLSKGADVNAKTTNGRTALRFTWTVDMAGLLIANGANVNIQDEWGATVLHGAVNRNNHQGEKPLVELLLKHGADVNVKRTDGQTPFHVACRNGAQDIVELLLAGRANVNAKTDKGYTPLSLAKEKGHKKIAELLRKHGAKE